MTDQHEKPFTQGAAAAAFLAGAVSAETGLSYSDLVIMTALWSHVGEMPEGATVADLQRTVDAGRDGADLSQPYPQQAVNPFPQQPHMSAQERARIAGSWNGKGV